MLKQSVFIAAALCGVAATSAHSTQPYNVEAGYSVQMHGHVPVICRASVQAATVAPGAGQVDLGTLSEFCNSASGYQVWADHSASLAGASLVVDGREVRLSDSGSTLISQSSHAAVASRTLGLQLADGTTSGSLSIRVRTL